MASLREKTTYLSEGPDDTARLGERLGRSLQAGDVVCLEGELGAGKTCLTQGIARGWGVEGRVTSPTFTLLNEYERVQGDARLYHLDCYRLSGPAEAWALGLDDVLDAPGVLVIEWPERILAALPAERLWITLEHAGDERRRLISSASGPHYERLLAEMAQGERENAAGN